MRDYSIVKPTFWIGNTGKQLRGNAEAQVLAFYLMTGPHATMTGVFHCPIMYMAHETGLGMQGASKGLKSLIDAGFCFYDDELETVFVCNMVKYQVGDNLKPKDNRVKGIIKQFDTLPQTLAKSAFAEKYWNVIDIEKPTTNLLESQRKNQAPRKPLRSQDQEQDQEQEQATAQKQKKSTLGLPLLGGSFFAVDQERIERFAELYPNIDCEQEIRNMVGWFDSNQGKLKPRTQILQFINSWLANRQTDFYQNNRNINDADPLGLDDTSWADDLVIPEMQGAER